MFPYSDDVPRTRFPIITLLLIAVNVVVFFKFSLRGDYESTVWEYGFIPNDFQFIDLFTSMFLHGGIFHLVFNMWYLWLFGDNLEDRLGRLGFLVFYLLGGAVAFLMHDYTIQGMARSLPCIGASGAISAFMGGIISVFSLMPALKCSCGYFLMCLPSGLAHRFSLLFGSWSSFLIAALSFIPKEKAVLPTAPI